MSCTQARRAAASRASQQGRLHKPPVLAALAIDKDTSFGTRLPADAEGFTKTATGGGPMNLTGNITLCSRSDLEPTVRRWRLSADQLSPASILNVHTSPCS